MCRTESHVISREKSSCNTGDKVVIRRCNTSESFRKLEEGSILG